MLTVLVTGAAGYIGSVLCQRLLIAGDYQVIAVDNFHYHNHSAILSCLGHKRYEFFQYDVLDARKMKPLYNRADIIIPLAALVGAPACQINPDYARDLNFHSIEFMTKYISRNQDIIYPNTNSGYGETDGESFVTEEDELKPISVYGVTKCDAEKVVLEHSGSKVFRLATVFGASPRQRFDLMVNDFTYKLTSIKNNSKRSFFEIYEPHFKRNFVHVRDVANAFIFAIQRRYVTSGVFNLGDPAANMTKMELAQKICSTIGLDADIIRVGQGEDKDKRNYLVSNKKILDAGFKFEHSLDDGIREVHLLSCLYNQQESKMMGNNT